MLDLLGGVEQDAVVDAHGVDVVVLDDGAVHEAAEVAQRAGRAGRWWSRARRRRAASSGATSCMSARRWAMRDRELVAGGALGDARADRLGEGELAAQAVALARR